MNCSVKHVFLVLCASLLIGCGGGYDDFSPKEHTFTNFNDTKYSKEELSTLKKSIKDKISNNEFSNLVPKDVYLTQTIPLLKEKKKEFENKLSKTETNIKKLSKNSNYLENSFYAHRRGIEKLLVVDNKLISASGDGTVGIWDLTTGKKLHTLKGHKEAVTTLEYSDNKLFSGSEDNTIKMWNFKTGKLIKTLKGHKADVEALAVSKNRLYSGGEDNQIKVWSIKTGKLLKTIKVKSAVSSLTTYKNTLISAYWNLGTIFVHNTDTFKQTDKLEYHKRGVTYVTVYGDTLYSTSYDKTATLIDLKTKSLIGRFDGYRSVVRSVLPLKDKVLLGTTSGDIIVYNTANNDKLLTLEVNGGKVYSLVTVNNRIYSSSYNGKISIWNLETLDENLKKLEELKKEKTTLANNIKSIKHILSTPFEYSMKELQLSEQIAYKHGKIGEYYVPTTTYSSSTPKTQTTYINGNAYNKTTYENNTSYGGGYTNDRMGYKGIIKINNNSKHYYLITTESTWRGKYTTVESYKQGAWGDGDTRNKWGTTYKSGSLEQHFILKPGTGYKFQAEIGEAKASISTKISHATIIDQEYYEALIYAMDSKNRAVGLIDKFLQDKRIKNWHSRLQSIKKEIKQNINDEFSKENIESASVQLIFPENYDPDFKSNITVEVSAGSSMCVHYKAPFGSGKVYATNGLFSKTGKANVRVQNVSRDTKAKVTYVTETCN